MFNLSVQICPSTWMKQVDVHLYWSLELETLPIKFFVIVDGQGLEQPNLVKAIDVCFKLFYILNVHYPCQCAVTWEFIQKVLYGIEDKQKGKTSPAVIAMRAALK